MSGQILEENLLPTSQTPYFIRPLERTLYDLSASQKLQMKISQRVGKAGAPFNKQSIRNFILNRDGQHGITLGVFIRYVNETHPRLIAQGTLALKPATPVPMNDEIHIDPARIGQLEWFMTDPEFAGNALMTKLTQHLQKIGSRDFDLQAYTAVINVADTSLYNPLLRHNYVVVKAYKDPQDNQEKYGFMYMENPEKVVRIPAAVDEVNGPAFKQISMLLNPEIGPTMLPIGCVRPLKVAARICRHKALNAVVQAGNTGAVREKASC